VANTAASAAARNHHRVYNSEVRRRIDVMRLNR
jgi:hypothetical protein